MFRKYTSSWRSLMPHFHEEEWEGFIVNAKPIGKRGWRFLGWLPYFSGNKPAFNISIKAAPNESRPLKAHLFLLGNTGNVISEKKSLSKPDKPFTEVDVEIELKPIDAGGDHSLRIHMVLPNAEPLKSRLIVIASFRAIVQETITLLIIGTLLALFGAVVGGLIVHLLAGE